MALWQAIPAFVGWGPITPAAGIETRIGNDSLRAAVITAHLKENGGTFEKIMVVGEPCRGSSMISVGTVR
jgi:hypothetical protein